MRRYDRSIELTARARSVTPGGAQTMSRQASRFPEGAYPAFLIGGYGCRVWDVDDNEYVDWVCGLAAVTLGYQHPEVCEAMERQMWKGITFSLPHRLEIEVAEMLCKIIPCAEQVRFVKTGSEATEAAIRVARAATGKHTILTVGAGYHSWHSWFAAAKPDHPGVPWPYGTMVRSFRYNNLESLDIAFHADDGNPIWANKVAAVILEPTLVEAPAPGFLQGVKDLAHQHGALLIFDEIVTGFRWATGGGQEFFGVIPDLACFGKGMANGMPLACLVGPRELMKHAELVSGTFGGECLSLAAAKATIEVYRKEPVIARLWEAGLSFKEGLQESIKTFALPAEILGYAVHPVLKWDHPEAKLLMSLFLQESAANGVLLHPGGWNVSYAHDDKAVLESIGACHKAFSVVADALSSLDTWRISDWLKGKECQDSPIRSPWLPRYDQG